MKIISIAAVTAEGKTTVVNKLKEQLNNVCTLHFDDYIFEGEVDDFYQWVLNGADLQYVESETVGGRHYKDSDKWEI